MPENTAAPEPNHQDAPQPDPVNLEEFDLNAFINEAVRPSKVVPIAKDRQLGEAIEQARQQIADLEVEHRDAVAEGRPSRRRAASTEPPELEQARADLAALTEQARGQFIFVRVEDVTRKIRKQARKDSTAESSTPDGDTYNLSALSMVATIYKADPRERTDAPGRMMSIEQWDDFAESIGVRQYETLIETINEMTAVGVSPDFSQPASPSPDGDESSKS